MKSRVSLASTPRARRSSYSRPSARCCSPPLSCAGANAAALLVILALAMLAFAALDIREVAHQLEEDHAGVAILAAGVAILHLAAAGLAAAHMRWHAERAPTAAT
jgi:hypothetical protein